MSRMTCRSFIDMKQGDTTRRSHGNSNRCTHLDFFDRFSLQPEREEDRTLHSAQTEFRAQPFLEVKLCHGWQQIQNDVVIQHVVGI